MKKQNFWNLKQNAPNVEDGFQPMNSITGMIAKKKKRLLYTK